LPIAARATQSSNTQSRYGDTAMDRVYPQRAGDTV